MKASKAAERIRPRTERSAECCGRRRRADFLSVSAVVATGRSNSKHAAHTVSSPQLGVKDWTGSALPLPSPDARLKSHRHAVQTITIVWPEGDGHYEQAFA